MIHIVTYAHKRPDFIKIQYESIKKYIKGDYKYIVFNNAIDSTIQYDEINKICTELNIDVVDVLVDNEVVQEHTNEPIFSKPINGNKNQYANPNVACSYPIIWTFKKYLTNEEKICIIDSDMFFIKTINLDKLMDDKDIFFIPQYRNNSRVKYIWNAFVCLNFSNNNNLRDLDWNAGRVEGIPVDVGGQTHKFLSKNSVNTEYIHEYSISSISKNEDSETILFTINGNINYNITVKDNNITDFNYHSGNEEREKKSFIHEKSHESYQDYLCARLFKVLNLMKDKDIVLPKPEHIGLIGFANEDDFFIVHYKSGSNYISWYTDEYNKLKTNELKKFI